MTQELKIAGGHQAATATSESKDHRISMLVTRLDVGLTAVAKAASVLSAGERRRAERLGNPRARHRFIAGRARLRHLLGDRLGVSPHGIELTEGEHGKPRLGRMHFSSGLRFSVAHADDISVYAFANEREIGVDLEPLRPLAEADNIARCFFSPREQAVYASLGPWERQLGFFNCWTRKEALIKAIGCGLHLPLDTFDVSLKPEEPAQILRFEERSGDRCGWTLQGFTVGTSLVGALVVQRLAGDPPQMPLCGIH